MKKRFMTGAMAALLSVSAVWAVPAKQGLLQMIQPDGTVVELRKTGDERSHIVLTPDGYPVSRDAQGFYCYARIIGDGRLEATSVKAQPLAKLSAADKAIVEAIDLSEISSVREARLAASRFDEPVMIGSRSTNTSSGKGLMNESFLGREELKGLVILAEYEDVRFSPDCNKEFFEQMLNTPGFNLYSGTGSARDYFIDASNGAFVPEFDVYGPVTLPNPMAYYGGNNDAGSDKNAARMIYDACKGLDDEIDFSEYDLDGDGYVDNVFVFYAGFGEVSYGSDDSVWPHQWTLGSAKLSLELDGVKINRYACSNELSKDQNNRTWPDGVGTFVHEFSHVIGLPDLYVTSGAGDWTPGMWDVLDQGPYNNYSRTPPTYSVYERNALGWIDPVVIDGPASISLEAINLDNEGCVILTTDPNEFFLIENRQQLGWDRYIPGHGMLVWHVDFDPQVWARNQVNNRESHNYVDIEEASGSWVSITDFRYMSDYIKALAGYAFPGSENVTAFTDNTKPSMKTWNGLGLGLPITEITEDGGVISFNVAGGRCEAAVPEIKSPESKGEGWFEAAWYPAEGAVDYILEVKAYMGEGSEEKTFVDFGEDSSEAVLPDGWDFVSGKGDTFSTKGYWGESAPALKLSKTGTGVISPLMDADITSLSLWARGQMASGGSHLVVDGLIDGNWTNIANIVPVNNSPGQTHTVADFPEGVRQVRITYNKTNGNVAIDDIVLEFISGGFVTMSDYRNLSVGNVLSHKVDKLLEGVDLYTYRVRAVDVNGRKTDWSETETVGFGENAGIDDILASDGVSVAVDGLNVIYSGVAGDAVVLTDLCGRKLSVATADASGNAVVAAPAAGVYVVSAGTRAFKVCLQ